MNAKKSVRFNELANPSQSTVTCSLPSYQESSATPDHNIASCLICCRPTTANATIADCRATTSNSSSPNINIKSIVLSCNCCSCTYRVLPSQLCVSCCRCCCSNRRVAKTTTAFASPLKTAPTASNRTTTLATSSVSSLSTTGSFYSSSIGTNSHRTIINSKISEILPGNEIKTCENCVEHPALLNYIVGDKINCTENKDNSADNELNVSKMDMSTPIGVCRKQVKKGRNNELITVYSYEEQPTNDSPDGKHDNENETHDSERKKNEKRFYSSFLKLLRRHMNCASNNSSNIKSKSYSETG